MPSYITSSKRYQRTIRMCCSKNIFVLRSSTKLRPTRVQILSRAMIAQITVWEPTRIINWNETHSQRNNQAFMTWMDGWKLPQINYTQGFIFLVLTRQILNHLIKEWYIFYDPQFNPDDSIYLVISLETSIIVTVCSTIVDHEVFQYSISGAQSYHNHFYCWA